MPVAFETLTELLNMKRSVIPSGGGEKHKAPIVDWTEFQKRLPTLGELYQWYSNGLKPSLWGIVTGEISGVIVFDADDASTMAIFNEAGLKPHVKTKRGEHFYFRHPGHLLTNKVGVLPHLDLRGDGGFVNCLGENEDAAYSIITMPKDDSLYQMTQLPLVVKTALLSPTPTNANKFVEAGEKIPQGQQDNWLFGKARGYRDQGDTEDMIVEKLKIDVLRCDQNPADPFTERDFRRIAKSALSRSPLKKFAYDDLPEYNSKRSNTSEGNVPLPPLTPPSPVTNRNAEAKPLRNVTSVTNRYETLRTVTPPSRDLIKEYLVGSLGKWVFIRDLDNDLGIKTPEHKNARRQAIFQLVKAGQVEKDPILDNKIRFINDAATKITLTMENLGNYLDIKYPFMLQNIVNIYPKNIILIAGSMNSGKTAFLLNLARMNKEKFKVVYFSSEMAEQELANRVIKFGEGLDKWANVDFRERAHDFADVIRPDDFNIVDYIELNNDIWQIGGILESIYNRLNTGIAVVAIQKKVGALFGRGQEFSAEKPRLYISMDSNKLTIVKGKNWHDPKMNPNRLYIKFKLVNGCEFIQEGKWQRLDD